MADPTLRDVTWGSLALDVATDLAGRCLTTAPTGTVEVSPSYQGLFGRRWDVELTGATLGQVREIAAWLDERVAGPADG